MKEQIYLSTDTVIVNLSAQPCNSADEIAGSEGFSSFLQLYFKQLAVRDIRVYRWLTNGRSLEEIVPSLIELVRQLLVSGKMSAAEPMSEMDRYKALYIVEDCYSCWRSKKRFTVLNSNRSKAIASRFVDYDEKYCHLIRQIYRKCRQRLLGRDDKVYRQSESGSNGSALLAKYRLKLPGEYAALRNVPFISRLLLHTPIMMEFDSSYRMREPLFLEDNPLTTAPFDSRDYFCLPLKVGDFLCLTYFHKDYMAQAICLTNLFELAEEVDCLTHKAELICLFGLPGEHASCGYYHDEREGVHLAAVSCNYNNEHFAIFRDAVFTLHNLALMDRDILPVRGAMMEILFHDDSRKNLLLIGELGAGKSETIEALRSLSNEIRTDKSVRRVEVVFDDVGSLRIADGKVVAKGSAIGGLEGIDDLWQSIYRDIEKGIFINLQKDDPKVLLPITSYEMVSTEHAVDMVLYANNYENRIGVERFEKYEDCRRCLREGRHMVIDDQGKEEFTSTYFANPYGPAQREEQCQPIMDQVFGKLYENDVFVGQLFTNLASNQKDRLQESARCLWELIRQLDS